MRNQRRSHRAPPAARSPGCAVRHGGPRPGAHEKLSQLELALEQARYEATRARRRYEAVDPDNRLVAGELERRWNERLLAVRALEKERGALLAKPESPLSEADRERVLALGSDLERAWNSRGATPSTR